MTVLDLKNRNHVVQTLALFCKANLNIPHFVYPLGKCFIKLLFISLLLVLSLAENNVFLFFSKSQYHGLVEFVMEKITSQSMRGNLGIYNGYGQNPEYLQVYL